MRETLQCEGMDWEELISARKSTKGALSVVFAVDNEGMDGGLRICRRQDQHSWSACCNMAIKSSGVEEESTASMIGQ